MIYLITRTCDGEWVKRDAAALTSTRQLPWRQRSLASLKTFWRVGPIPDCASSRADNQVSIARDH
jgi:hypothetical protein